MKTYNCTTSQMYWKASQPNIVLWMCFTVLIADGWWMISDLCHVDLVKSNRWNVFIVDNTTTPEPRTCSSSQFRCANNRCIPQSWRCDHDNDCYDYSDEMNCTGAYNQTTCGSNQYTCAGNSTCIPQIWRCDGGRDCPQGDDEQNCRECFLLLWFPTNERPPKVP